MDPGPATRRLDAALLSALLLAFAAFVAATWARWPLLTADSARELYVPFQIHHGAVLYRDFYYLYGPVAPTWSALLLRVFGESLTTLYLASAIQVGAIAGLLYAIARQVLRPWPAAAVVVLFLSHGALGRDLGGYLWPYAFAATYAVLFGLAELLALLRYQATGRLGWLALAGVALGLSLLTKLEFGAAAAGLAVAFLAARAGLGRWLPGRRPWLHEAGALAGPASIVAGGIAAGMLAQVDWPTIRESVWPVTLMAMWNSQGVWHGSPATWKENVRWLGVAGLLLGLAVGHRRLFEGLRAGWAWRLGLLVAIAAGVAFALGKDDRLPYVWEYLHRFWLGPSFAVAIATLALATSRLAADVRADRPLARDAVAWGLIAGYALLVCARTLFQGMNEYTLYQVPAALVCWVGLAAVWLPAKLVPEPARRGSAHAALAVLLALLVGRHLVDARATYATPWLAVRCPQGEVRADRAYAEPFNQALAYVRARLRPHENVVAGPMEPSFYLFLGRDNVVKEDQFFYGYLPTTADQADFIRRLKARQVRFVVISSYGYGHKEFGLDYAQHLAAWLASACRHVARFESDRYGLTIYETPFGGG